jgi:hypothetical protein
VRNIKLQRGRCNKIVKKNGTKSHNRNSVDYNVSMTKTNFEVSNSFFIVFAIVIFPIKKKFNRTKDL